MIKGEENSQYWDSEKAPLLLQGFEIQATNDFTPVLVDQKDFVTRVNRGVVVELDYLSITLAQIINGLLESDFNASQITCVAGGQEILVDEPAERYDYAVDLGDADEHRIKVFINGGQTITSRLFLPDVTSNSATSPVMVSQLHAYYSTKRHQEFIKKYSHFGKGLGLKRRSYRLRVPISTLPTISNLPGVIPKNQGRIIGFSFLFESNDPANSLVSFSVDDVGLVENVIAARFSRYCQRDPFIFWYELNPGSTFNLSMNNPSVTTTSVTNLWLTIYFDN
jgi:hypothetical protein